MRWIIFACALISATPAAAGDRDRRDNDDWWFYTTIERNSPRARQERANQERQQRQTQDEPQQLYQGYRTLPRERQ